MHESSEDRGRPCGSADPGGTSDGSSDPLYFAVKSQPPPPSPPPPNNQINACPLCRRQCSNRSDLLVHLSVVHYRKQIAERFLKDGGRKKANVPLYCPECGVAVKTRWLLVHHLGSSHERVLDFLDEEDRVGDRSWHCMRNVLDHIAVFFSEIDSCHAGLQGEEEVQVEDRETP